MPALAADLAYLVGALAGGLVQTLLGLVLLFVVVLVVRDGLAHSAA